MQTKFQFCLAVRMLYFNFHFELGMVLRMDESAQPDVSSGGQCELAPHPLMGCSVNIGTSLLYIFECCFCVVHCFI